MIMFIIKLPQCFNPLAVNPQWEDTVVRLLRSEILSCFANLTYT